MLWLERAKGKILLTNLTRYFNLAALVLKLKFLMEVMGVFIDIIKKVWSISSQDQTETIGLHWVGFTWVG